MCNVMQHNRFYFVYVTLALCISFLYIAFHITCMYMVCHALGILVMRVCLYWRTIFLNIEVILISSSPWWYVMCSHMPSCSFLMVLVAVRGEMSRWLGYETTGGCVGCHLV